MASDIVADTCVNRNWLRAILSALPAWFRFAQCLRRYKDTREAFPHLVNAGKYSTTLFVTVFSFMNSYFAFYAVDNVSCIYKKSAIYLQKSVILFTLCQLFVYKSQLFIYKS